MPALDGLRGLAVAGVLAFHLGWIDGGYLGVDAFFVLSGYLITSLLVAEHTARGTVSLRHFWSRRARRLLPAMLVMVAVVLVWAMVDARDQLASLRGDAVATLLYVANWHEIATSSDYWAIFDAPSPLQHAWSLAIEEQFYLLWPLAVVGLAAWCRRRGWSLARAVGVSAAVVAAVSYTSMAVLYGDGDVARAYYGTVPRLGAIALGAALATLGWAPRSERGARALQAGGVVAVAALAWAWLVMAGTTPALYRGGFLLLGLAVVLVIAAVTQPGSRLGTAVSWAPLRALGLISYGLYLWHWVVIATVTPARTGLDGAALDAVQLVLSLGAALASYWWLEQPIRHRRWLRTPATAVPAALGAYAAVFGLVAATTLVAGPDLGELGATLAGRAAEPTTTVVAPASTAGVTPARAPVTAPRPTTTTLAPLPPARIVVLGDSTALRTGVGLLSYATRTGAFAVIANAGGVGCGVDQGGQRRFHGAVFELDDFCGNLAARWEQLLADRPGIDAVVVQTGLWESVDRRLPGDTVWRRLGDPVMDARIRAELDAANAFWASRGIPVVWLRGPAPAPTERPAGSLEHFNELLEASAAGFPTAVTVPLDGFVDGLPEADRTTLRPDGIHFTEATSVLVADTWLGPQVTAALDHARRAPAHPPVAEADRAP